MPLSARYLSSVCSHLKFEGKSHFSLTIYAETQGFFKYSIKRAVENVTAQDIEYYGNSEGLKIVVWDFGAKENIVRVLRNYAVITYERERLHYNLPEITWVSHSLYITGHTGSKHLY